MTKCKKGKKKIRMWLCRVSQFNRYKLMNLKRVIKREKKTISFFKHEYFIDIEKARSHLKLIFVIGCFLYVIFIFPNLSLNM